MNDTDDFRDCQQASRVKRLVAETNARCESECVEADDLRYPLAFTVFENRNGPVSKHYELGPGGAITSSTAKAVLYDARGYRAECRDLDGLAKLLERAAAERRAG